MCLIRYPHSTSRRTRKIQLFMTVIHGATQPNTQDIRRLMENSSSFCCHKGTGPGEHTQPTCGGPVLPWKSELSSSFCTECSWPPLRVTGHQRVLGKDVSIGVVSWFNPSWQCNHDNHSITPTPRPQLGETIQRERRNLGWDEHCLIK